MLSFITFDRSGANKYFDNFKVRTGIPSWPHDFLESNPLSSVSISSGVVGDKKIQFVWRGRRYFFIFVSVFLDGPEGVRFDWAEVTKLWFNAVVLKLFEIAYHLMFF